MGHPWAIRRNRFDVLALLFRACIPVAACLMLLAVCAPSPAQNTKAVAKQLGISEGLVKQIIMRRDMSPDQLMNMPKSMLPRIVRRLAHPDLQRERQEFRYQQDQNAQGIVPSGALMRAANQLKALQARTPKRLNAGIPVGPSDRNRIQPLTAGLERQGWVWKGPGNIGGRTRSLIIHPEVHDSMLAGSVGGGIWRTTNGGQSWEPVNDFLSNLAVTALAFNPTNPNILYAGTGEGFNNLDAIRGAGIFKSVDGGVNWELLEKTANPNFERVNRIAVSPAGNTLLAATPKGIYRSVDEGQGWSKQFTGDVTDINFHPQDNRKAIAGGRTSGQIYLSENGGVTWQQAQLPELATGRAEVTYALANPQVIYAAVDSGGGTLFRSDDGGQTFQTVNSGSNFYNGQGWYNNIVWAGHPTDANFVLIGGLDLHRSTDGGAKFEQMSVWWNPQSIHADHHLIVAHPKFDGTANKTVFFCNDGGIYKTDDVLTAGNNETEFRGNGWVNLNNNYGVTQLYHAAGNAKTGTIIAGAQDNGTLRFTTDGGVQSWNTMFGGDGGWCAADPSDDNVFYGEYIYLQIHRSTDGGKTSEYITGNYWNETLSQWMWKEPPYLIPDAKDSSGLFIAPFLLDPKNPNCILGGGAALWRTNNAKEPVTNETGPAWESIKEPIELQGQKIPISCVAIDPRNSDNVWVGYIHGVIHKTKNATATRPTWENASGQEAGLPQRWCHHIEIDPSNSDIAYAAFGEYVTGNVWKTTNGGNSWVNIAAGLPQCPVRSIAIHPNRPNCIYIGTEVGIFASEDGGGTWSPTNEGPTNCSVDHLFWMGKQLVAATHGRGIFTIDLGAIGK